MTDFSIRDNLKSILAQKMAEFNSAMSDISRAETEAIFANLSADRAEQRASELENAMTGMANIKQDSAKINNIKSQIMTLQSFFNFMRAQAMLMKASQNIEAIQSKIDKIKQQQDLIKANAETQVRNETFKMLDWCTEKLEDGLGKVDKSITSLDKKIDATSDPEEKLKLQTQKAKTEAKRQHMQQMLERAEKIKQIKDNKEAMKEFHSFAEDLFMVTYPDKTLTQQELKEKLAGVKPKEDSVQGYFESLIGIWDQYMEGRKKVSENSTLQKVLKTTGDWSANVSTVSSVIPGLLPVAATVGVANLAVQTAANVEQASVNTDQQAVEHFRNQESHFERIRKQTETMNKNINQIKEQNQENQEEVQRARRFMEEQTRLLAQEAEKFKHSKHDMVDLTDSYTNEVAIDQTKASVNELRTSTNITENRIEEKQINLNSLSSQIYEDQDKINSINQDKNIEKDNLQTEAKQILDNIEIIPENKDEIVKKLTSYVKNSSDEEVKVVLDKSLSMLHEHLSKVFGEDRVVVDKRNGDRRGNADRRTVANSPATTALTENSRSDSAGRRKGDRRESNHIFISQDTIKHLNFQS